MNGKTTRELSFESMLIKLLHKTGVCRKRDWVLWKNYSHFFNTKSRLLKVVKQAFVRLTFAMNEENFP